MIQVFYMINHLKIYKISSLRTTELKLWIIPLFTLFNALKRRFEIQWHFYDPDRKSLENIFPFHTPFLILVIVTSHFSKINFRLTSNFFGRSTKKYFKGKNNFSKFILRSFQFLIWNWNSNLKLKFEIEILSFKLM